MRLGRIDDAYKKLVNDSTIATLSAPAIFIHIMRGMKAIKAIDDNNNKISGDIFIYFRS